METTRRDERPLEDQFTGCLAGGAVGDALWFVTENLSRERIKAKFGEVTDYRIRPGWGYYTDDTQLTILLTETLLESGGYDHRCFRRKLGQWWTVYPRLSGRSMRNAALKCLLGLEHTGRNAPGSGCAMRAAPLALFYHREPDALFQKTVDSCRVTHTHPSAIAGALVSTFSIRYCLTHQELDQEAYLSTLADVAGEYDPDMKQRLVELPDLLHEPVEQVWEALFRHSSALRTPVWDVIPVAIYAFLKYPDDYARCVLFCVNAGWDTDTMAAIAGNTSGAWHGLTGIPQRWLRDLENGYKGRDYIIALGRALHGRNRLPKGRGFLSDYLADWGRNVRFLSDMFMRKPFV